MKIRSFLRNGVLVASLLAATMFQVAAQPPGGGGGGGGGGRGGMGVLTQEQRTQMRDAIQGDLAPLMEKLAAAHKEVVKAALAPNASEESVKTKLEAVNKLQTEVALLRLKGIKAIASTLTAEQKSQLEGARDGGYTALFGGGFAGGRGGGGGGGGRRGGNNNNN